MIISHIIDTIDVHAGGAVGRVFVGGLPPLRGRNMVEKMNYVKENLDWVRRSALLEPRGNNISGRIITEPCSHGADIGVIFFDASGYIPMCGAGTIEIVTVLLETGIIIADKSITTITLDTPAGLVKARAYIENGSVKSVAFRNVPSFLFVSDEISTLLGYNVQVDIAYGGNSFAIVDAEAAGIVIEPQNLSVAFQRAREIQDAINKKVKFVHPENPMIREVDHVLFYAPSSKDGVDYKDIMIMLPSTIDRSPCGTGVSALVALLYAKRELKLGEKIVCESVIGSTFSATIVKETKVGPYYAVIPEITGSAYIIGMTKLIIDPNDPFKNGFSILY